MAAAAASLLPTFGGKYGQPAFKDKDGHLRTEARIRWWDGQARPWATWPAARHFKSDLARTSERYGLPVTPAVILKHAPQGYPHVALGASYWADHRTRLRR